MTIERAAPASQSPPPVVAPAAPDNHSVPAHPQAGHRAAADAEGTAPAPSPNDERGVARASPVLTVVVIRRRKRRIVRCP
jgi:hypothetical protein